MTKYSAAQNRYITALTLFGILESEIASAAVAGEFTEDLRMRYRELTAEVEASYRALDKSERLPQWVLNAG